MNGVKIVVTQTHPQRGSAPAVVEVDERTFEQAVLARSREVPVVVDFWAPWCGPCRTMAPAFDRAAAELAPRVRLAKLDTEAEPEIAARFGIRSIPTLVAFRGGREIARQSGAMALQPLVQWIGNHVAPS